MVKRKQNQLLPAYTSTPFMERIETLFKCVEEYDSQILQDLRNPDKVPEKFLPVLATALSVDHWDTSWDEAQKRRVCASAIAVHREKGTISALKLALESLEIGAEIEEWFNYDGEPYCFRIQIKPENGLNKKENLHLFEVIGETKNLRSFLDKIIAYFEEEGVFYAGGVPAIHHHIRLYPVALKPKESYGQIYAGGGCSYQSHIYIQPEPQHNYSLTMPAFLGGAIIMQEQIYVN